ncbi:MAG: DNA polymerase IV [Chloroflexi bacterium]|nr:MAG: DNA polymerase IV [Chloroflexota bacterium]
MNEQQHNRWIIHADLDAFFAAVAVLERPELAGLPVLVGGSPTGRGVVSSASYEARAFGVRSAMPMAQALRLCPHAIVTGVSSARIRDLSQRFQGILRDYSPLVEVVSVDEAYLDASGSERLFGGAEHIASEIKRRVRAELGLVVSLGVATNRLVAKIASELDKPDGLRVVLPGQEAATLAPLPVGSVPGIGPKTAARLRHYGLATLGELAAAPESLLALVAGEDAAHLRRLARGEDERPIRGERDARKSIGHERTFARDRRGLAELEAPLFALCQETGMALRRKGLAGQTVCLKLRYNDFTTITRQLALSQPTDAHQQIFAAARALLSGALHERAAPVRLIGVRVSNLAQPALQLGLFDDRLQRTRRLNAALDQLAERSGGPVVTPARYVRPAKNLEVDQ